MKKNKALLLITILVYVFLIGPLLIIMAASFSDTNYLTFPGHGFTLKWYAQVLTMKSFISAAQTGKDAIKTVFLSPVLVPVVVLGFVMLRYVVNVLKLPVMPSLLIGHTLLGIPYVMRVVTASLANFDFAIEEAAGSLGATKVYSFFHIILPNIKSAIASASIMAMINSFNNVSLSAFLTGPGVNVLPIEMMSYVEYHFDPTIAALATLMMVITLGIMLLIEKTLGLKSVV